MQKLIIGSRDSKLALIQTEMVAAQLRAIEPDLEIEIIKVKSEGDLILDKPLYEMVKQDPQADVKGLFTKELEHALLAETIDIAVHSMKDLPTTLPIGLEIACTSEREDIRDVVCFSAGSQAQKISEAGVVATSSPRRIAQLKLAYPQLEFVDMRGNLQTRFRKLDESQEIDAIILAAAGIKRLGLEERISEYLDPSEILPAIGQGALAVEIKSQSACANELRALLAKINSCTDELIIQGERSFLRTMQGGCTAPIGIYSVLNGSDIQYTGRVLTDNQDQRFNISGKLTEAAQLGEELAKKFL